MATPKAYHRQLKPNERGVYRVAIGKIADRIGGSTARFDLGRESREAVRRLALLQALYEQTHSHGYWIPACLDVAKSLYAWERMSARGRRSSSPTTAARIPRATQGW